MSNLATDFQGFTLVRQHPGFRARVLLEILRGRRSRLQQTRAAERRHILAPDVSPGWATRNGTESRRNDIERVRTETIRRSKAQSKLRADTAQTVAPNQRDFSPWNERDTTCI
jgi:hypothetical protein